MSATKVSRTRHLLLAATALGTGATVTLGCPNGTAPQCMGFCGNFAEEASTENDGEAPEEGGSFGTFDGGSFEAEAPPPDASSDTTNDVAREASSDASSEATDAPEEAAD